MMSNIIDLSFFLKYCLLTIFHFIKKKINKALKDDYLTVCHINELWDIHITHDLDNYDPHPIYFGRT